MADAFDPVLLGHQVRHARKQAGLTLAQVGDLVGKPAPYLSQLENGKIEPKLRVVSALAVALNCETADLLSGDPPNRRAALEMAIAEAQRDPRYKRLNLGELRPTAKVPDDVLEHVLALYQQLPDEGGSSVGQRAGDRARRANHELRLEMRKQDNYFPAIEKIASDALAAVGYPGAGPLSERLVTDLAAYFGFRVERVNTVPRTARSITDQKNRVIYIPQRDDLKVRAARSVVLHTLGHYALDHTDTTDFSDYLRQRVESNYFAAATLVPEVPATEFLIDAKERNDISIEDLKERFYVSYEMAAHRFTNLATAHLGISVHFLRTDPEGNITKAYENDGIPYPFGSDQAVEGQRIGRHWGARQAWASSDSFLLHYQHTQTDRGVFWCVTYIETANERTPYAVTIGSTEDNARFFRGGDTLRRSDARLDKEGPDPALIKRWEGSVWPSAAERSHVLSVLPSSEREFSPYPGVDLVEVYRFLDRQQRRST